MASKKSKSVFRQPNAKHFQLVHRSQRDPLIHDPDAPQHVLKPFVPENAKKGKTRTQLEELLGGVPETRANVGEASLYGIYYDDSEYDYMQHLRTVGLQEDGVESILLEAPSMSQQKNKGKSRKEGIQLSELPEGVLASTEEVPKDAFYETQQSIPSSLVGFQPDMDPHLRQVLEALEDDAFVDDTEGDDFFGELVKDGERDEDEIVEFEFEEWGVDENGSEIEEQEQGWEARFKDFKKTQQAAGSDDELEDEASEVADTITSLPMSVSVIGGSKRRRKRREGSEASGFTMSSSSLWRSEGHKTLDEAFDQLMKKEYGEVDDDEDEEDDASSLISDSEEEPPNLITPRPDFPEMVDNFLDKYEVVGGRKLREKLEGDTGAEKLETLRRAMGVDKRVKVDDVLSDESSGEGEWGVEEDRKNKWDCESILSTYSNLENHPRLIRARKDPKQSPIIRLDPKTGLPSVQEPAVSKIKTKSVTFNDEESSEDSDGTARGRDRPKPITRPRDESPASKAARKKAVKAERADRRKEKKDRKEIWTDELKKAKKSRNAEMGRLKTL
ncbi:Low temperature viability protein-domain-containing protein [Flagelloscypha sp. PMI_526]|nr:Low temperature viability protein-domain-containing protein [Flagelloscypha sp. PMI_526]